MRQQKKFLVCEDKFWGLIKDSLQEVFKIKFIHISANIYEKMQIKLKNLVKYILSNLKLYL